MTANCTRPGAVDRAVGVEQAGEQRAPLGLATPAGTPSGCACRPSTPTVRSSAVIEPCVGVAGRHRRIPADGPPQSGQVGGGRRRRHRRRPSAAGATAGLDLRGRGTKDAPHTTHARSATAGSSGSRIVQPIGPAGTSRRPRPSSRITISASAVVMRAAPVAVAEPGAQHVRVDREVGLRQLQRTGVADRVVQAAVGGAAPQGARRSPRWCAPPPPARRRVPAARAPGRR